MAGIDALTGKVITGWEHTAQSLRKIFTTPIGSRVMRRFFGSSVPALLGRSLTVPTILRFKTAVIVAIELWEPRFRLDIVHTVGADTIEDLRQGRLTLLMEGEYRPRGHLGDPTPEQTLRRISVERDEEGVLRFR